MLDRSMRRSSPFGSQFTFVLHSNGCQRPRLANPYAARRRPLRWITHAASSSKSSNPTRNPQKAYRISSVGQSVLDTLVDVEVGDSARQEAETWRSLQQFSRNALELTRKRLQGQAGGAPAAAEPTSLPIPWLKRLWPWGRHGLLDYLGELNGKLLYSYFNWRQDTGSDLQLFAILSVTLVVTGGLLKGSVVKFFDSLLPLNDPGSADAWWRNFYQVGLLLFGENFPPASDPPAEQVFSLVTASIGLASFALILALVEQVVLEVIEEQVARGSRIYESGHFVVLVWGNSQRDLEAVERILSQVCQAHRADGGRVVVVMSQREKLDMEALYRRQIPPELRHGSSFVFRQGSPLDITDLRDVSVSSAAAVIVLADNSRSPEDADAQALRAAVILDELDFPGWGMPDPRSAAIIVELKTPQAVPLLRYSTSKRILALPTSLLNARRVARMVTSPISATVSRNVWNFKSHAQTYLQQFPQLVGIPFGDLHRYFDDGTPFGLLNMATGVCSFNPSNKTIVSADDLIVMNRPSKYGKSEYQPLSEPVPVNLGNWTRRHWARNHGQEGVHFASQGSMDDDGSIQLRLPTARHAYRPERPLPARHQAQQKRQADLQQQLADAEAAQQAAQAERRQAINASDAAHQQQMQAPGSHRNTVWPAASAADQGDAAQPSLFRYIEAEQLSHSQQQPQQQPAPDPQSPSQPPPQPPQDLRSSETQARTAAAPASPAWGKTGRKYWEVQSQRGLAKKGKQLGGESSDASWDDPTWSGPGPRPNAAPSDPVKRWPSQQSGYDSDDPTWSGIGPRPAKRQAFAADAGGKAAQNSRSPEERWASLIGTAPSRIAAEQEAEATPEPPPGPASGLKPAARTAVEASGAHEQCAANAVNNAVARFEASALGEAAGGATSGSGNANEGAVDGDGRSSSTASGATLLSCTAGSGNSSGNSSDGGSGSGNGSGNGIGANGSIGAPPGAMPWTYDYMLFILPRQYTGWSYTERVLLCGWGETQFMADLLAELDHGPSALPPGSSVTLLNSRPTTHIMGFLEGRVNTQNISVGHVSGDPRQPAHLRSRLRLAAFSSAIVLCDVVWTDPDPYDGVDEIDRRSDVRLLDSLIMTVQLNIRKLLQEEGCPDINIICERITVGGLPTRFEDQTRLPMGVSVNSTSYSAKLLQAAAYDPGMLTPMLFGDGHATHTYVQDTEALASPGEELSWWQLMGRARTVGQVLLGYFEVPFNMDDPVSIVVNPQGAEARSATRVWNRDDLRTKLIVLGPPLGPNADRRNEVQRFALKTRGDEAALPILSTTMRG